MSSDQEAYLLFKAQKGLTEKGLWDQEPYRARINYEWDIICRMGFAGYYLVVADYVAYARSVDIPVGPGRGSGAGSLMAYAVGITDVDSLKRGLMFERFLNPGRVSMPDFDIDFGQRRRLEVVQYCIRKYGASNVCQIGTTGTMKSRLAVKDVARTMGVDPTEANRFSSLIPEEARGGQGEHAVTLEKCLNPDAHFFGTHQVAMEKFRAAFDSDKRFHDVVSLAASIEGIPKSFGVHPAGVIIANDDLSKSIPLRVSKEGMAVSQWSDKQVEAMGFVKFDFLGLRTLDVIQDACASIKRRTGLDINWDEIDESDSLTYEMLSKGDCRGVFQLEASGIAGFTRQFKPSSIEDISTISALYRPGPLDSGMVAKILKIRSGEMEVDYPHEDLVDILSSTDGVLTYQEQTLALAQKIAGYDLGEADLLRRAIGKKLPEEMAAHEVSFKSRAKALGYEASFVSDLWSMIQRFADYGFNKSHSFAYSILSFRTAYLKAHYPADFYAAELTSWDGEVDKMMPVIVDARRRGIRILPPDVNESDLTFTASHDSVVRFGLAGVKGMGSSAIEELIRGRSDGPFRDVMDLCDRVDSRLKVNNLVALAKAGAFSLIEPEMNPLELEQYIPSVVEGLKKRKTLRASGQLTFFDYVPDITEFDTFEVIRPKVPVQSSYLLELEKEALGVYVSGSPLDQYQAIAESINIDDIASLEFEGLYATVLARVTDLKVKSGRAGSYAFAELDDGTGLITAKVWSNKVSACLPHLSVGSCVVVRGRTSLYKGVEIMVDSVVPAMDELVRLRSRIVLTKLDLPLLNEILQLPLGSVPIDLEVSNTFRYRLGRFDVKPNHFEGTS